MEKNAVIINKKIATSTKILEVSGDIIVPFPTSSLYM